jgi:hypothetical protein
VRAGRIVAVAAGVAALAACGCGSDAERDVASLLRSHLEDRELAVKWVVCGPAPANSGPPGVQRCNVSFGDPHIQIYCAAIVDERLVAAEWRQAVHGVQDRRAAARECAARLQRRSL